MNPKTPIECLSEGKKHIQKDIQWYQQKNSPGIEFFDEYRKERIAELKPYLAMYDKAIKRLKESS